MGRTARFRGISWAIGASIIAIAAAAPVAAQCSPDPTVAGGTTTCAGTDTDGLTVSTSGTQVTVTSGALVQAGPSAAAIAIRSVDYLTVNGTIAGGLKSGVMVAAGAPITVPCDPYAGAGVGSCYPGSFTTVNPSASATITVASGGTISGAQALLLTRDPSNNTGNVSVTLVNSGSLNGSTGPAIVNNVATNGTLTITNQATGTIGGISGPLSNLTNAGRIDGGTAAAIAIGAANAQSSPVISNSGQIVSQGAAATLSYGGSLTITNATGATLGGSATAISVGGALTLTNAGAINGSVVSTATSGQNSTIDTRLGVINGNLQLGAGNDTLRAVYDPTTGRLSSITGTVDGGGGVNTIATAVSKDTSFGALALPTNFTVFGVDLSNNAVATVLPGFNASGGISVTGSGTLFNQATLAPNGQTITAQPFGSPLSFINQGTITATLTSGAVAVGSPTNVTNNGTITATGGAGVQAYASLTNSGVITATQTAANVTFGTLTNTGTIRSTASTGLSLAGQASYLTSTNSGTIIGATTGASVSNATLVNGGTISGGTTGVALNYSGTLVNAAGGMVNGGVRNVGSSVKAFNAGTINGDVNLVSTLTYDNSNDVFVDNGGTVNGAIRLGGGDDLLVVDLATAPGRPLAGATGGVDAGGGYDNVRYRTNADASALLVLPTTFEGLQYEIDNKASLSLAAPSPIVTTIGLTGNGTVTLNGTISTSDHVLIDTGILTVAQLQGTGAGPKQALTIVNNGALNLTSTSTGFTYPTLSAINAGTADVVNNGTISVKNSAGSYAPAGAIVSGTNVTNNGTINLVGGTAIANAQNVINSGTITDTAGSGGYGVNGFKTLINSGTIRTDNAAVQAGYSYGGSCQSKSNSSLLDGPRSLSIAA